MNIVFLHQQLEELYEVNIRDGLLLKYICTMSREELCCSAPLSMNPYSNRNFEHLVI